MKFLITLNPKGKYLTAKGIAVDVVSSTNGKDYADEASFVTAFKLVDSALAAARASKLAMAQTAYNALLSAGYLDPATKVTIGIKDTDQASWTSALAALANAEKVTGTDLSSALVTQYLGPIYANDGSLISVPVTVGQFRTMLMAATQAVGAFRQTLLEKQAAINAATTVDQVNAIN